MTDLAQRLASALAAKPVAIFAGAGISAIPPTDLPSWSTFNEALIDELCRHATRLGDVWAPLVQELSRRTGAGEIPTEYLSQIISNRIGARYFLVLKSLEGDRPNAVHGWLARLAAERRLPVIVTTNFDTLIERALEQQHVPHRVISQPEHFEAVKHRIAVDRDYCHVLKIHGSVTDTGGRLVDTLAQRLVGLPEPIGQTLVRVLDSYPIYFMGTSGSDLRAGDDYLHLRRGDVTQRKLFWVTPPGLSVQPVVASLMDHYKDRGASAEVLHARLPEDLPDAPSLGQSVSPRAGDPSFAQALEQWGADIGAVESAQLLTDFSDHIGLSHIGVEALEQVLPSDPYMPVGALAPLAVRLAEILAGKGDTASAVRAIALLNQAERSGTLSADDLSLRVARARVYAAGSRLDEAIRELSGSPVVTSASDAQRHEAALIGEYDPDDIIGILQATANQADALRRAGRYDEAITRYDEGIALAQRLPQVDPLVPQMKLYEASILSTFGRVGEAVEKLESAKADAEWLARQGDDSQRLLGFMINLLMTINDRLSVCHLERDALDEAQNAVASVVELGRILGGDKPDSVPVAPQVVPRVAQARLLSKTDDPDSLAAGILQHVLKKVDNALSLQRSEEMTAHVLTLLARSTLLRARFDAQEMLRRAAGIWELHAEPLEAAQCMRELAGHLFRGGEPDPAQGALEQAEWYSRRYNNAHGLGQCALLRAQWALQDGKHSQATALAMEALGLIPDRSHVHYAMANAIASGRWDLYRRRRPTSEQFPERVGELVGRARTVQFFLGTIEHAAGRYGKPYDRILYFTPVERYALARPTGFSWRLWDTTIAVGQTKSVIQLSQSNRDVGILLDEIAGQCEAGGIHTVAAMPFGGVDNSPMLSWIDEPGLPRELDIYFIDPEDYQDVIPAPT